MGLSQLVRIIELLYMAAPDSQRKGKRESRNLFRLQIFFGDYIIKTFLEKEI